MNRLGVCFLWVFLLAHTCFCAVDETFPYSFVHPPFVSPDVIERLGREFHIAVELWNASDCEPTRYDSNSITIDYANENLASLYFSYQYLGKTEGGVYVLCTCSRLEQSHCIYTDLLFVVLEQGLSQEDDQLCEKVWIRNVGHVELGDRWDGTVTIEGNRLFVCGSSIDEVKECWIDLDYSLMPTRMHQLQERTWDALALAVYGNDAEEMERLLKEGARLNVEKGPDRDLLLEAADKRWGPETCTLLLLDYGANIHACDSNGNTALHYAAMHRKPELAIRLLELGAKVEVKNHAGHSPLDCALQGDWLNAEIVSCLFEKEAPIYCEEELLHAAVKCDNLKLIQYLVEKGEDLENRNKYGETPLLAALDSEKNDIANYLIVQGADCSAQDSYGLGCLSKVSTAKLMELCVEHGAKVNPFEGIPPLHRACENGCEWAAILLANLGADINAVHGWDERTPLHSALHDGYVTVAEFLIERGADVNAQEYNLYDGLMKTPLHYAAGLRSTKLVALLIEKGADIHAEDDYGHAPFFYAVQSHDKEVINYFIEHGALDANPLHTAVEKGDLEKVIALIQSGANLEAKNNQEETPLHVAARSSPAQRTMCKKLVQVLVENGANLEATNLMGFTPLRLALANLRTEAAEYLFELGAPMSFDAHVMEAAAWCGSLKIVEYLEAQGVSGDYAHIVSGAANGRDWDMVAYFLSKGVSCDLLGPNGNTLLYCAVNQRNMKILAFLVHQGANLNIKGGHGRTPLWQAVFSRWEDGANWLIQAGADPKIANDLDDPSPYRQISAIELAQIRGYHLEIPVTKSRGNIFRKLFLSKKPSRHRKQSLRQRRS